MNHGTILKDIRTAIYLVLIYAGASARIGTLIGALAQELEDDESRAVIVKKSEKYASLAAGCAGSAVWIDHIASGYNKDEVTRINRYARVTYRLMNLLAELARTTIDASSLVSLDKAKELERILNNIPDSNELSPSDIPDNDAEILELWYAFRDEYAPHIPDFVDRKVWPVGCYRALLMHELKNGVVKVPSELDKASREASHLFRQEWTLEDLAQHRAERDAQLRGYYRKLIYPYTMTDEELKLDEYGGLTPETLKSINYYCDLKESRIAPKSDLE
jgi:hypothetical protein